MRAQRGEGSARRAGLQRDMAFADSVAPSTGHRLEDFGGRRKAERQPWPLADITRKHRNVSLINGGLKTSLL